MTGLKNDERKLDAKEDNILSIAQGLIIIVRLELYRVKCYCFILMHVYKEKTYKLKNITVIYTTSN